MCLFKIHCNPSLAYIAVRNLQSSQRNASVQSLLLAGNFCTTKPSAGEGKVANLREFKKKPQYLMNTLYMSPSEEMLLLLKTLNVPFL